MHSNMIFADAAAAVTATPVSSTPAQIQAAPAAPQVQTTMTVQAPSAAPEQAAAQKQPGGDWTFMIIMVVVLVAMVYLSYRTNAKEKKRRQQMMDSLRRGSAVVTAGGIHGEVVEVKDDVVQVKIASNTVITVSKVAITSVSSDNAQPAEVAKK